MPQRPGFDSARDWFAKLQREASKLNAQVTPDEFSNFCITAWSLCDWAEKDATLSAGAHDEVAELRESPWLQICRDIANGTKHYEITRYKPKTDASAASGYGIGRYGVGAYGVGESSITIEHSGTKYDALVVVDQVTNLWSAFFKKHA